MKNFSGFSYVLPNFLAEWNLNNNSIWFEQNRHRFDTICRLPAQGFLSAMSERVGCYSPPHKRAPEQDWIRENIGRNDREQEESGAAFNPFLHFGFPIELAGETAHAHGGNKIDKNFPALHIVFSSGGLGVGAGVSAFDERHLKNYHRAILKTDKLLELQGAVEMANEAGCYLENLQLKPSSGAASFNDPNNLYSRQIGLVIRNRNETYDEGVFGVNCVDILDARLRQLLPFQDWLVKHVYQEN